MLAPDPPSAPRLRLPRRTPASEPAGLVLEADGRVRSVTPGLAALVGHPAGLLRGALPPFVFWPPEAHADWQAHWLAWRPEHSRELVERWRRADGTTLRVVLQITPQRRRWPGRQRWLVQVVEAIVAVP